MNKQAGGAVAGPTAAAAAAAAQKQKSLLQRSDNEINSILENFTLLIKAARSGSLELSLSYRFAGAIYLGVQVNIDPSFRSSQEAFQMEVHATRVVQAADSLLKLVSELKQTAVFSDFASLNKHVEQRVAKFEQQCEETDQLLATVGEEAAASLKELESHYYSSVHRSCD